MANKKEVKKPVHGPAMSPSNFEAKWLAKFNALLTKLKTRTDRNPMGRFEYDFNKQALSLVVAFEKEAQDLGFKEDDFNMDPLPFERFRDAGLLPIKHQNPFEAAEAYRSTLDQTVEERKNIKSDRENENFPGCEEISDQDIADMEELALGVAKAKQEGFWPKERIPRRRQIVEFSQLFPEWF